MNKSKSKKSRVLNERKEKFNEERINRIHQMLQKRSGSRWPLEYEIRVDELKVVNRTRDVSDFMCYKEFISTSTSSLIFNIYSGGSHHCDRYHFMLKEADAMQIQPSLKDEQILSLEKDLRTATQRLTEVRQRTRQLERTLLAKLREVVFHNLKSTLGNTLSKDTTLKQCLKIECKKKCKVIVFTPFYQNNTSPNFA